MSIRKLKRRAMARLNCPRVEFKLSKPFMGFFAGMNSLERENRLRAALNEYVRFRKSGRLTASPSPAPTKDAL